MASSSSSNTDVSQLNESQQEALQQFISITASSPTVAVPILRRADWNVQVAVTRFFDGETAAPLPSNPSTTTTTTTTTLPHSPATRRVSTSARRTGLSPAPRIVPQPSGAVRRPPFLISLLLFPLSLLWRISHSFVALFRIIFPFLRLRGSAGGSTRLQTIRRSQNPRDTAARFIRLFEEEYGVNTGLQFFEGGYAQALDTAKSELKFLLVLLQSEEHDDTATFNRQTLTHPSVISFLKEKDIILWAGSVQDSEAYQVSTALSCTSFPFLALIAFTPSSANSMSVLTRINSLVPPQTLISKLDAAITSHMPTISQVRSQRAAAAADRALRDAQNSAYEASLAADRERARLRREREAREKAEREAEERRKAEELRQKRRRLQWRQWRRSRIPDEKGDVRVSVRLTDGTKVVRKFDAEESIEEIYAWIECFHSEKEEEETEAEENSEGEEIQDYKFEYGFKLVNMMPRRVFEPDQGTIGECLGRNGNLVVEELVEDE